MREARLDRERALWKLQLHVRWPGGELELEHVHTCAAAASINVHRIPLIMELLRRQMVVSAASVLDDGASLYHLTD